MKIPNYIKDKIRTYSSYQNKSHQLNLEIAQWFANKKNMDVFSVHDRYDTNYSEADAIIQDLLVDLVGVDIEDIISMIENELEDK